MKDVDRPTNGEDKENMAMRKLKELPKPNALGYNADLSEIRPKFSGNLAKEKLVSSKSERFALKPVANSTNGQMRTAAKKRMSPLGENAAGLGGHKRKQSVSSTFGEPF